MNEQLQTVLKEAEAVVNYRPLVYVGDDVNSNIALKQAHFLSLNPKVGIPDTIQNDIDDSNYDSQMSSADRPLTIWKKVLKHPSSFWKIWRDDYLLSLRGRSQNKLNESRVQSPYTAKVGDVMIRKDDLPRESWKMRRIHELIPSTFSHSFTPLKESSRAAIKFTLPDRVPDKENGWNIAQIML